MCAQISATSLNRLGKMPRRPRPGPNASELRDRPPRRPAEHADGIDYSARFFREGGDRRQGLSARIVAPIADNNQNFLIPCRAQRIEAHAVAS